MPFNQQMSFPAELTLHGTADGPRLFRYPVREIELLYGAKHEWNDLDLKPGDNPLAGVTADLLQIEADIDLQDATAVEMTIRGQPIVYDMKKQTLSALGEAPLALPNGRLRLTLLVDRTSLETFADGGRVSLTSCYLPSPGQDQLSLQAEGGTAHVRSLVVHELKSAWPGS